MPTVAQWTPDSTYFDADQYIEYRVGDYPLILSMPHGGYLTPANIPDRNCANCVYLRDSYTQELGRRVHRVFSDSGWCRPHLVINRLHRKKMDANRDIVAGADGDPLAEQAWRNYHNFIDTARSLVLRDYGQGLFLDVHGHAHTIQRAELGYRLTGSELRQSDALLNAEPNSVAHLVQNGQGVAPTLSALVRDAHSFGDYLTRYTGADAVPSSQIPFPLSGEPFFSGGYNTLTYGSQLGGTIDAIQIECHQGVRFQAAARDSFAIGLAQTLKHYLETHYTLPLDQCLPGGQPLSNKLLKTAPPHVYPNPTEDLLQIHLPIHPATLTLYDLYGQAAWAGRSTQPNATISLRTLPAGTYVLWVTYADGSSAQQRLVKTAP